MNVLQTSTYTYISDTQGDVLKQIENDWLGEWRGLLRGGELEGGFKNGMLSTNEPGQQANDGINDNNDDDDDDDNDGNSTGDEDENENENEANTDGDDDAIDPAIIPKMKVADLRERLKARGADTKGGVEYSPLIESLIRERFLFRVQTCSITWTAC